MIKIAMLAALGHAVAPLVGGPVIAQPVYCSVWQGANAVGNAPAKADFVLSPNLRQCVPAIDIFNSHELVL